MLRPLREAKAALAARPQACPDPHIPPPQRLSGDPTVPPVPAPGHHSPQTHTRVHFMATRLGVLHVLAKGRFSKVRRTVFQGPVPRAARTGAKRTGLASRSRLGQFLLDRRPQPGADGKFVTSRKIRNARSRYHGRAKRCRPAAVTRQGCDLNFSRQRSTLIRISRSSITDPTFALSARICWS